DTGEVFYELTLNTNNTYTFELVTPQPTMTTAIGNQFGAGQPVETINLNAGSTNVTFDGLLFDSDNNYEAIDLNIDHDDDREHDDYLNPNGLGFGIANGNLNDNEGFVMSVDSPASGLSFEMDAQTGSVDSTDIHWAALNDNNQVVDSGVLSYSNLQNVDKVTVDVQSDVDFSSLQLRFDMPDANDGVRIQNFSLTSKVVPDDLTLNFSAVAGDGDDDQTTAANFSVTIDSVPTAVNDIEVVEEPTTARGADVVLIIDTSGSMEDDAPGKDDVSIMDKIKQAVTNLFGEADIHSVFLATFSVSGKVYTNDQGGFWFTDLDDALSVINELEGDGGTNYKAALETVMDDYVAPPAGGNDLISFFLSDGEPSKDSYEVDRDTEEDWYAFLTQQGFTNAYAVGFGGLSDDDKDQLEPVAWREGEARRDITDGDDDSNVIIVSELDTLAQTLGATIGEVASTAQGNLLANDISGADAPISLVSLVYQGQPHTFADDGNTVSFNVSDAQGVFGSVEILANGDYTFTPTAGLDVAEDRSAAINYTIKDSDGDTSTAQLTVSLNDSSEVVAVDNVNNALVQEVTVPGSSSTRDIESLELKADDYGDGDTSTNGSRSFTINEGETGKLVFDIEVDSGEFQSGDQFSWELYKGAVSIDSKLYTDDSDREGIAIENLSAGSYTLKLSLNDSGKGSYKDDLEVELDDIKLTTTMSATAAVTITAATGNVLADSNTSLSSSGKWGASDDLGAEGAVLAAVNGTLWDNLTDSSNADYATVDGYKAITGSYGDLFINNDGDYAYVPDTELANVGEQEVFSYTLTQPDGDSDSADLVINIADSAFVAETAVTTATSEGDLMLGGISDDMLDGAAGNDHLEGAEGNDILIGGSGNDILIGGDGADSFKWESGDEGTKVSPASDIVSDFNASEGDSLNLADLLHNEESNDITDYISVTESGSDVVIEVTPAGKGDISQVITLEDTSIDALAGVDASGLSQADIINTLISNGQLNVDQS
uniref:type I secretion C-terminal target domain-containing protein n=1 Tax=Methylophaga sp. TaxID=2024840 RepID=UPI003F69ADF4